MRRSGYPRAHLEVALAEMCALPTALELRRFLDATRKHAGPGETVRRASGAGAPPRLSRRRAPPAGPARSGLAAAAATPVRRRTPGPVSGCRRAGSAPDATPPARRARRAGRGSSRRRPSAGRPVGRAGPPPWTATRGSSMLQMLGARRAALGATLNGSAVTGEEERILRVAVPRFGAFQKGQLEKAANKQLIMELIQETFGRPLGVRFEPAPEGMVGAGAATACRDAGAGRPAAPGATGSGDCDADRQRRRRRQPAGGSRSPMPPAPRPKESAVSSTSSEGT